MFTKWGKKLIQVSPGYGDNLTFNGATNNQIVCIKGKTVTNADINLSCLNGGSSVNLITSLSTTTGSNSANGIAVGSGDTPATENDYTIESIITTLTTSATPTVTPHYDTTTGKYVISVDLTLSNATSADIIVKEVCRFSRVVKGTNLGDAATSSQSNWVTILIDRTVLETPLTVPAGGAAVLRYGFEYDMDAAPSTS